MRFKKKLGVRVAVPTGVRVLEGVSNPFKVQESKTKPKGDQSETKDKENNDKKPSPPVPAPNLEEPTSSTHATQHGQAQNGNGQNNRYLLEQNLGQSTSSNTSHPGQAHSSPQPNDLQAAVSPNFTVPGEDQHTGSSELAHQNHSAYEWLNYMEWPSFFEDDASVQENYGTLRCGRVLLQWDTPHVELKEHWNFLDQLMPLYSTKSRFYTENFPSTSVMDKSHKLLAIISSGDSVSKMITSGMTQATQTPQRRGILIRPIGPYASEDEPPLKKRRNPKKYQLRFVNRVCSDYYTREQIKSEDGTFLKVALYDENNLVVTSGQLSSASVEVVLLHGDFNAEGQHCWTSEEFSTCLVHPQSAKEPPALGGDRVLALTDGEADLCNVNFRISSFHARTGKFKMGVAITNVREENVQEGITSPFVVRVRLGEEPSRHRITSLESLHKVRVKLPDQVCVALEHDAKENVSASSALDDQSSQVISVLGTSTASDGPPEPSLQGVEWSTPSALLKAVEDEDDSFSKIRRRMEIAFLSIEKKKGDSYIATLGRRLKSLQADFENLQLKPRGDCAHKGKRFIRLRSCRCFDCEFKTFKGMLSRLEVEVASSGPFPGSP